MPTVDQLTYVPEEFLDGYVGDLMATTQLAPAASVELQPLDAIVQVVPCLANEPMVIVDAVLFVKRRFQVVGAQFQL